MTPTKESLDRAELWCEEHGLTYFDPELVSDVADPSHVISLALLLDRVRLEGQIEIVNNLKGAERHEWWEMAQRLSTQLVEHPRQGTALNQPAGEGKG